ncbi:MAG: HIT domain-containing protein [Alphaproteobacteria bacterium]|nr:HIT domain-containing protein [Alphaproteobacteria bacterium]
MSEFKLVPGLAKKEFIVDLPLSTVLMDDKKDFPWLFLVPRRENTVQMNTLSQEDQIQLMKEITFASNIMEKLFPCDRINVAAIGNMTPQLHVHIICRTKSDQYWPDVIWNKPMDRLSKEEILKRAEIIRNQFKQEKGDL